MLLAEELVGEARKRRSMRMSRRERVVSAASAAGFVSVAIAVAAFVPDERALDLPLVVGLTAAYAVVSRVRFEFGDYWVSPEQLVFVPMILLVPLPWVPTLVALAVILSMAPDVFEGSWHRDRVVGCLGDNWFSVGPVLVLALLAPGEASLEWGAVYALALVVQVLSDLAWVLVRNALLDHIPFTTVLRDWAGVARVEAVLSPVALMYAVAAVNEAWAVAAVFPLVWLLQVFARDRQERYASALELQRAYRGTVTLLSDVVEFEDPYTAAHSRSIVELAEATAERMGVPRESRQRLEFAALLHDVGKIAIPKEILNKPASLDEEEFNVMKTHTIEGQFMLDRVGGLLGEIGEIVRSCHERWDGRGYPDGLAGEEIPLTARIVFACDAYNAMTTDRVYRRALSTAEALEELRSNSGTQFDPTVVRALVEIIEDGEPATAGTDEIRAILARQPVAGRVGATA